MQELMQMSCPSCRVTLLYMHHILTLNMHDTITLNMHNILSPVVTLHNLWCDVTGVPARYTSHGNPEHSCSKGQSFVLSAAGVSHTAGMCTGEPTFSSMALPSSSLHLVQAMLLCCHCNCKHTGHLLCHSLLPCPIELPCQHSPLRVTTAVR